MRKGLTELVFILDKSNSMSGREKSVVDDFNKTLLKQKEVKGDAYISTILFSNTIELLHDRLILKEVLPISENDYVVSGCTALLDTIGETINKIKAIHKYSRNEDIPERTLFLITTDGMENASKNFSYEQISFMIKEQENLGWKFIFVAENLDCAKMAIDIGFQEGNVIISPQEQKLCYAEHLIKEFRIT